MSAIGEFDIMDWIESGTVARRTVVIYNDPALVAEYEELERQMQAAEQDGPHEVSVGERSEVQRIEAAMRALHERWEASKATWTVQALSDETVREISKAHPLPPKPVEPAADADDEAKAAGKVAMEEWATAWTDALEAQNLAMVSAAVVSVETAKGAATTVPVEVLRAMRKRPHGAAQTTLLIQAVQQATAGDVEIPAPKSVRPSENDRA